MKADKENIYNLPNALSAFRLLTFPALIYLILTKKGDWFAILLCINLVTDILDGWIARAWKLQTALGAKLDSLADISVYIAAFWGVFTFKQVEIGEMVHWLWPFVGLFVIAHTISFIRFGKWPSLHLYSSKVGGYIQGSFFFVLFAFQYVEPLFILALVSGYLSWIEEIIVLILLKEYRSNVKGLYWVLSQNSGK